MRFDVFGSVLRAGAWWAAWKGGEGKLAPAGDVVVPATLAADEVGPFLRDTGVVTPGSEPVFDPGSVPESDPGSVPDKRGDRWRAPRGTVGGVGRGEGKLAAGRAAAVSR